MNLSFNKVVEETLVGVAQGLIILGLFFGFLAVVESQVNLYAPMFDNAESTIQDKPEIKQLPDDQYDKYTKHLSIKVKNIYIVDMKEGIGLPETYYELNMFLSTRSTSDGVIFKLHNSGGYLVGLNYLLNLLSTTKAETISDVDGESYSAGAMLACGTQKLIMRPHSLLMYHSGSSQFAGKTSDNISRMKDIDASLRGAFQECVRKGILTSSQIDEIMNGKDIYLRSEDLKQ